MDSAEVIALYESVADLTNQMLAAARDGQWDLLSQLEVRCAQHVDRLKEHEARVVMSDDNRERKVAIIKKILEHDRNIRDLTEPGLKQLSALIQNTSTERKLAKTYGMTPGG